MNFSSYDYLLSVIQEVSQARDQLKIMNIVKRAARKLTGSDGAAFVLRDDDHCYYADEEAISPLWKGQRFPMRICISGWCMLHKEAVIIKNIFDDSRIPIDAYRPTFVRSLAMVPIRQEDPIGAIGNYWATPHEPSDEEMRILQALADSVSVAMKNVQLTSELEQRIRQLKAADRAKDEFLMTLSHELRTPIQAIQGGAELLQLDDRDEETMDVAIHCILKGTSDQMRIVNDLLDSSRILTDRIQVERELLLLTPILSDVLGAWQKKAERKGQTLVLVPSNDQLFVQGDPARLAQIFDNIIANAIKFTPQHGTIRIELGREGPMISVRVFDTGEGIEAALINQIFEAFKQSDSSPSRKHGGLGLGLSIAKHLIETHGGSLKAESAGKGKGSTFTVLLPYAYPQDLKIFHDR